MTSIFTHDHTVAFFEKHNYFGLSKADVFFFRQGMLPSLTAEGKIIMSKPYAMAQNPDGNGGIYKALRQSGALADIEKRGLEYMQVYGVDNALVKVGDPTFFGFASLEGVDVANKVCEKKVPTEKVGVYCFLDGEIHCMEYSEISESLATATNEDKTKLLYYQGNIAQHMLSVSFIKEIAQTALPYHLAHKAIPQVDRKGATIKPASPNGYKLETFIFDAFVLSKSMSNLLALREAEFAAVKNKAVKGARDSPVTAREALSRYHISLVQQAGGKVKQNGFVSTGEDGEESKKASFEISPLVSYAGEGLEKVAKGEEFDLPSHLSEK